MNILLAILLAWPVVGEANHVAQPQPAATQSAVHGQTANPDSGGGKPCNPNAGGCQWPCNPNAGGCRIYFATPKHPALPFTLEWFESFLK